MAGGEFVISGAALNLISIGLLYTLTAAIGFRYLLPRLSSSGRKLASLLLVLQALVVGISTVGSPTAGYQEWLWHLDREFNLPAVLASTQLAVCGGAALMTSWRAKALPAWQRAYFVALGGILIFWAMDEYFRFHEFILNWHIQYAYQGAIIALATLLVAMRSPRRARGWYLLILGGLALTATGAILVERIPLQEPSTVCGELGLVRLDPCWLTFGIEEALEFAGIWLALVGILGFLSLKEPAPRARVRLAHYLLPLFWLCALLAYAVFPVIELALVARPATAEYASGIQLSGYRIKESSRSVGVELYVVARKSDYVDLGFSIHLVDQASGASTASDDRRADLRHSIWFLGPDLAQLYRTSLDVDYPPGLLPNRALWIVLTHWRDIGDDFNAQTVLSSDHELLSEAQLILGELVLREEAAAPPTVALATFENGFALEDAALPERAAPGETLPIRFGWRSENAGGEDYVQFLHLGHKDSGQWWVYDHHPLGARLPTRLWYAGLADSQTWAIPLPADLGPGLYEVFTGLYRSRDQERLPARDRDGESWPDARVRLGEMLVERVPAPPDGAFAAYMSLTSNAAAVSGQRSLAD